MVGSGKTSALGAGEELAVSEALLGKSPGCFGITAFQSEPSPTESSLSGGLLVNRKLAWSKGERSKAMSELTFGEEAGVGH